MIDREMQLKIKIKLLKTGLRQTDLCRALGVPPPYLSRCINGLEKPSQRVMNYLKDFVNDEGSKPAA